MPATSMQLLKGSPYSPYTRKMTALLRFRHIPYRLLLTEAEELKALPKSKVGLLPTFYFKTEAGRMDAVVDSTPIIRRFEKSHTERSVLPDNPALAFLDYLLEDFADEWLTKAMFHYRWHYQPDIERASKTLPQCRSLAPASDADLLKWEKEFADRQISRLYVVGSNNVTTPVIEDSYKRYLTAFNTHLKQHMFLFGARPSAADFAAYGQLTQLAGFDPTPTALTEKIAPRVFAWVEVMDDLSGMTVREDAWIKTHQIPDSLLDIFRELGRGYVPVMLANAKALINADKEVKTEIQGKLWTQSPFPYQGKCLQWIREKYEHLDDGDRKVVTDILAETGCLPLVE
ncbi:glutathione S-transferase family protein [Sneathiella aquimaris]|uniref:glutathione S-transferase family protein n=1 Tax=Sneathiella aquimaris TaxID=2599305 RepID=UPI00146A8989|nr:glutathione S-transferase family protein [Sneathiella aquimaris]